MNERSPETTDLASKVDSSGTTTTVNETTADAALKELTQRQAIFALRALLAADYINDETACRTIRLVENLRPARNIRSRPHA